MGDEISALPAALPPCRGARMDFQFLPLELWRASSLAQETKTVIAAYERCLAAGDLDGLSALRRAIERRIDDLEAFYLSCVDDERSVLFEKQRLKLRKLLHEYDSAVAAAGSTSGLPAAPMPGLPSGLSMSAPGSPSAPSDGTHTHAQVITRTIREDTRLGAPELLAWFAQSGCEEMPEVSTHVVERVFAALTRTNTDGRMSVRELRAWYLTFGKRALREGLSLDSIVSADWLRTHGTSHGLSKARGGERGDGAAARRPLYAWEKEGAREAGREGGRSAPASPSGDKSGEPLVLPNGMVEFQVRLTPEEFHAVQMRRRALEAEAKYKQRLHAGKSKAAALRGERPTAEHDYGVTSLITTGPYVEPTSKEQYFYRSP